MQLTLSHVSYRYPGASQDALRDLSATFPQGWTGLIGDNGCGKTTLAMIAAGLIRPDVGTVTPQLCSAYCPQDSSQEPPGLSDFALDWGREAAALRHLLAIEDDWPWRFQELSGGQRRRLQIACCLWKQPDLLAVDEPTNDLDAESREAVAAALGAFQGVGLLIAHDRALLDRLASQCLVFRNGSVAMRPGGYGKAAGQIQAEALAAERSRDQAKREAERLRREAQRRQEEARRSKGRLSGRNLAPRDSSGREKLGRAKVSAKDSVAGRASAAMARRAQAAQGRLEAMAPEKRYSGALEVTAEPLAAKTLCHVSPTVLRHDGFSLAVPELWVAPTDHIAIVGGNGMGKSTLVRHLLDVMAEGARVAYVPQEVGPDQRRKALERLRCCNPKDKGEVLAWVARLNSDPACIMDGDDLSPGEMRKLLLAELLLDGPHGLVLDEPANHLDVGSIEALQGLLRSFAGAVLLVSHDAALVQGSCERLWSLKPDGAPGSFAVHPA